MLQFIHVETNSLTPILLLHAAAAVAADNDADNDAGIFSTSMLGTNIRSLYL